MQRVHPMFSKCNRYTQYYYELITLGTYIMNSPVNKKNAVIAKKNCVTLVKNIAKTIL